MIAIVGGIEQKLKSFWPISLIEKIKCSIYSGHHPKLHRLYLNRIVLIVGTPCLYSTNQTSSSSIDGESKYPRLSVMSACCVVVSATDAHELDECLCKLLIRYTDGLGTF